MLQSMRNMSQSWLFKGLMTLLVVSFAIWGVGDAFRTNPSQRVVARVGKEKIVVQDVEFRFQILLPEARRYFGADLTPAQAKQAGVMNRALNALMEESSFQQEAGRLGLNISNTMAFKKIAEMPNLLDENGKFDKQRWQMILNQSNLTEKFFIEQKKKDLMRDIMLKAIVSNTIPPKTILDNLYQAQGAKRIFEVISLRNDSRKDIPTPTEETLKNHYSAHENEYAAPEYRGITVATLSTDAIAKTITISDADAHKAYEKRSNELERPEQRDLVQLVFQDEEKAKAFYESTKNASSFKDAAKGKGLTPVSLGKVDEKSILPELYTSVFSLEEGEISQPTKSDLGWHVIWVKKIYKGGVPSFAEIKDELKARLQEERLGDVLTSQVNQLDDAIAAGKTLEDIAETMKLHLERFAAIDGEGKASNGKTEKAVPNGKATLEEAFSLNSGEVGQVLDDGNGHYYAVRTDSIEPSQIKPYEKVKSLVYAGWKAEQQTIAAQAQAEKIAAALRKGAKATNFATEAGVEIRVSNPMSKLGGEDKSIPAQAKQKIFDMNKGDVTTLAEGDKHYILRLAEIVPVNAKKPDATRFKIVDEMNDRLRIDILEQYANHLHTTFPREIDMDLLNTLKN